MRIHLVSDLHLEQRVESAPFSLPEIAADVTVLAGDIHEYTHGLVWAAEAIKRKGRPVIYVPGNHEYYNAHITNLGNQLRIAALEQGIHLLNNSETVLNGVRFLGTTLWTDFELHSSAAVDSSMRAAKIIINDFKYIRV